MSGNTFGTLFRITTYGESHGSMLGVVIDGCPAGVVLDESAIANDLQRRCPGQSKLTTSRKETDGFQILSGVFEGRTTGTPIHIAIPNQDVKSKDYAAIKDLFRPGHADFTYFAKYGHRDYRGGGRASARETVARVAAGSVAKQVIAHSGMSVRAGVVKIGSVVASGYDWDQVEDNIVRSVDPNSVDSMVKEIESAYRDKDSVGGLVEVQALGVRSGLGEPVFDKLDAALASALMSIPAVKAVEVGEGFASASARGSDFNDEMYPEGFASNRHGGILGGISSGAPIVVRLALKPTSSLPQEKNTIDTAFSARQIKTLGRHDPCVAIRAVPVAEAMTAIVLADFWLRDESQRSVRSRYDSVSEISYGLVDGSGKGGLVGFDSND